MQQKLLFLDTETTGREENDRLCQVAYRHPDGHIVNELFKPDRPIPPEASAVHHISNRMVANKPPFQESAQWYELKELLEGHTLIAHNAPFDIAMLKKEALEPQSFICTLRLARYLDTEGKIPRYNLQYLRYFLDLDVEATAHDAAGDVLILEHLFNRLFQKFQSTYDGNDIYDELHRISATPSRIRRFTFGKYNGALVEEVAKRDAGYLRWLYEQKQQDTIKDEDWLYTLKQYL